ncbi:MAG: biotin--[acetyl-CoA-carboxylase] ligase [Hyphomonadaceae bacterium]
MIEAGAPFEIFDEIDSTVLEARRRADFGDYGPVWMIARRQTAGRGRRGRKWASPEGNLYATYLGRTTRAPAEIALLGFAAGVAIVETIEAMGIEGAQLKWPNDVFIKGAKASGILLDSGAIEGGAHWFALAFGVNIVSSPSGIDQETTSLMDHGAVLAPKALLREIAPRIAAWAASLERAGFAALRKAWLSRAYRLGEPIRVVVGEETVSGRMSGLSAHGELEIETPAGVRAISAGDIHFQQAAH